MEFRHTADMGEISGFGGAYEAACQDMLNAGMQWLEANPLPDLDGKTFANAYGVFIPESDQAKALSESVLAACEDCTGAMHQAVMSRLFWIAEHGWDAYCAELRGVYKRKIEAKE